MAELNTISNDGTICIPHYFWKIMPNRTIAIVANEYGESLPSILSAPNYAKSSWSDVTTDIAYLKANEADWDTLQPYIDNITNNSYFIWGNVKDGGIMMYQPSYGNLKFCYFQGYFVNDSTGTVQFIIDNYSDTASQSILHYQEFFISRNASNEFVLWFLKEYDGEYGVYADFGVSNITRTEMQYTRSVYPVLFSDCLFNEWEEILDPHIAPPYLTYEYWPVSGFEDDSPNAITFTNEQIYRVGYTYVGDRDGSQDNDPDTPGTNEVGDTGNGNFDNDSDSIQPPDDSQYAIDGINSGFITMYNPTEAEIKDFNEYLFVGITESISTVLKRLIQSPLDYVVSLSMIHLTPNTSTSETIKFCGLSTGVSAKRVTKQVQIVDCGSVKVGSRYGTALDYGGYSKCKIYVPYCGIFPLSIDDVMESTISAEYHVDLLTGNCVFYLTIKRPKRSTLDINNLDSVLYQFTGNCINSLPISATDWRGLFQGTCSIAAGISELATGNVAAGAAGVANGVMGMKPDVVKSGNLATTFGYLGIQKPYLIFEWPVQSKPSYFGAYRGYPSNAYFQLKDMTGYTEVDDTTFWSMNIHGTDEEMNEIIDLVTNGIYI